MAHCYMALGAQQHELKKMFVLSGLALVAVGALIGLTAAAALASYLPARRAAAVDPVEVLKAE